MLSQLTSDWNENLELVPVFIGGSKRIRLLLYKMIFGMLFLKCFNFFRRSNLKLKLWILIYFISPRKGLSIGLSYERLLFISQSTKKRSNFRHKDCHGQENTILKLIKSFNLVISLKPIENARYSRDNWWTDKNRFPVCFYEVNDTCTEWYRMDGCDLMRSSSFVVRNPFDCFNPI